MKKTAISLIRAFIVFAAIQGCGYHNPYRGNVDLGTPPVSLYLKIWDNRTNELGLENLILRETADWLQQSRHLKITRNREQADYILIGTILSVDYPATAFSAADIATTLKAVLRTSYQLSEPATGKTLWRVDETLRQQYYLTGGDAVRSQGNKSEALETIAYELGEQIYLRITTTLTESRGNRPAGDLVIKK